MMLAACDRSGIISPGLAPGATGVCVRPRTAGSESARIVRRGDQRTMSDGEPRRVMPSDLAALSSAFSELGSHIRRPTALAHTLIILGCFLPLLSSQSPWWGASPLPGRSCTFGARTDGWIRTSNLRINNPLLRLLSYIGLLWCPGAAVTVPGSCSESRSDGVGVIRFSRLPPTACSVLAITQRYSHLAWGVKRYSWFSLYRQSPQVRRRPGPPDRRRAWSACRWAPPGSSPTRVRRRGMAG